MSPWPTPSQTVGPFFDIALPWKGGRWLVADDDPEALVIDGVVYDGKGDGVSDALVEIWQANRSGRYAHPDDDRTDLPLEEGFTGFGRCATDDGGGFCFVTVKPGPVPSPSGAMQAPHIDVGVFARGLLKRVATRIYFPGEADANALDPVLNTVPNDRRHTLIASAQDDRRLRFDIHLQGDREAVFFDV